MADSDLTNLSKQMTDLSVLSFRKVDEVKKLAKHFRNVINHTETQKKDTIHKYLLALDQTHRSIFTQKRDLVEVEYIFTTAKKSSVQRQRFNSLPISEVPELLKAELLSAEDAKQVHICTDCDVEIDLNDEVPLMESLQKHFSLEVHLPKLKRESIDVAEPILIPNMSRRLSAMECGELNSSTLESLVQISKPAEKVDKMFAAKLESALIRVLPDNSEASINSAMQFYQGAFNKMCQDMVTIDFNSLTGSVAPIIMSIKDNVNQNFTTDTNKNYENEENDQPDRSAKNQPKKHRYYGPIENVIVKLLTNHKLLSLTDDRTGKPAFFCMACEYYTLRFRYDSVLGHVFSDTHIHNLACILQTDKSIPFYSEDRSIDTIKEINKKFLIQHSISDDAQNCGVCKATIDNPDSVIYHLLDENHLAKMSDKLYHKAKANNPDGYMPEEWGPKSLDWAKFLAGTGKPLTARDHVVVENFIKPLGKIANYCNCCDMTLKGPRQVLFNHIRQKKHLRHAAPYKLSMLYKNHCRPSEYYASFGNYYICSICPEYIALPSFAAIVEHFESDLHVETIAKFIRSALYDVEFDSMGQHLTLNGEMKCKYCDVAFADKVEAITHLLADIQHQNLVVEDRYKSNKGDIISVYMQGNYILQSEGVTFKCLPCQGVFTSIRSLLSHLVYGEHFKTRPTAENVFRFYLELKHNINLWGRNKYMYNDFGNLKCGVCDGDLLEEENAKNHVVSSRHRENMGASYVNIGVEVTGVE